MDTPLAAVAGIILALIGGPSIDDPQPPADPITIDVVVGNGSGCPYGSITITVDPDNTAFRVTYQGYIAKIGPGAKPTDSRKNCQVNLNVHPIPGLTFAIRRVDHYGHVRLAAGARAVQRSNHYFAGMPARAYSTRSFTGPIDEDWQATYEDDLAALPWLPCGGARYLNLNTELRMAAGTSDPKTDSSTIELNSTEFSSQYSLAWTKCPPAN